MPVSNATARRRGPIRLKPPLRGGGERSISLKSAALCGKDPSREEGHIFLKRRCAAERFHYSKWLLRGAESSPIFLKRRCAARREVNLFFSVHKHKL